VRGPTPAATARRIGTPLAPLASVRGDLPGRLTRALDRALAPAARDRGTLEQLRGALARALEQAGTDFSGGAREPFSPARAARDGGDLVALARAPAWEAAPAPAPRRVRSARAAGADPAGPAVRASEPVAAEPAETPRARRLMLPRALWIGVAVAAIAWWAWAGRAGLALLALAALVPFIALTSGRAAGGQAGVSPGGLLAAALAPLLGSVGLAGAYPAVAGQASRWRMRAALGALGYWLLVLAEPLLARRLWLGAAPGTPPRAVWESSLGSSATHVLAPMFSFGVLLGACLWAAGAAVLPLLVRGRRAALDVVAVTMWSAALAAAAPLLDGGLAGGATHASPRGAVLGAVLGAVFAVAARALRGPV
jgi:hypothetical protein